jgi:hypothetical protein
VVKCGFIIGTFCKKFWTEKCPVVIDKLLPLVKGHLTIKLFFLKLFHVL